jgi:hypothetical protein
MNKEDLVIGCNYHTTWQSDKRMRFVLIGTQGDMALLKTRTTGKRFWTRSSDLIFIQTRYNKNKAQNSKGA